jgi:hypothetical protein
VALNQVQGIIQPQWSPSLNGGITQGGVPGAGVHGGAAMEPAAERRDQSYPPTQMGTFSPGPQWSPPLNGGIRAR